MLDIAYAAFRLHGGEEARTMWLLTQPLSARLQPAAETRSLVQRQNNLAGRAASTDRIKCFHVDLGQVGSLPAPLRACALAALGRSIRRLPLAEQLGAFQNSSRPSTSSSCMPHASARLEIPIISSLKYLIVQSGTCAGQRTMRTASPHSTVF